MGVIAYNKLVRDRIPEIIENDGKTCRIEILTDEEYIKKVMQNWMRNWRNIIRIRILKNWQI